MTNTADQNCAILLEQCSAVLKGFESNDAQTGRKYNIFKIANINEKEVIMCRVLADLLDPKGLHNQGDIYLKLFMDTIVNPFIKKTSNFNLSKAKVSTEYRINENRRIDIIMDDEAMFIPIEVKIYAGEQDMQIADYADYSRRINTVFGFIPVLFLTPDGYESSKALREDYIPVSFEKNIVPWLVKCLNLEETGKIPPVREIIKQFIRAIKSFCGHAEDEEMENAVNSLIAESRDNYEAAIRIYEAVSSDALNFSEKTYELFKNKIYNLIKASIPDAKYFEKDDEDWYYIQIPIGKDYVFYVNYNLELAIEPADPKKSTASEMVNKIRKTMFDITGFRDEDWGEGYIWASSRVKYPGLENIDNDKIYKYELYRLFSKEPQSVSDRIVSMVMSLKKFRRILCQKMKEKENKNRRVLRSSYGCFWVLLAGINSILGKWGWA